LSTSNKRHYSDCLTDYFTDYSVTGAKMFQELLKCCSNRH